MKIGTQYLKYLITICQNISKQELVASCRKNNTNPGSITNQDSSSCSKLGQYLLQIGKKLLPIAASITNWSNY